MDARRKSQVLEYQLTGLRGYLAQTRAQAAEIENPEALSERIARIERELQAIEQPKEQAAR